MSGLSKRLRPASNVQTIEPKKHRLVAEARDLIAIESVAGWTARTNDYRQDPTSAFRVGPSPTVSARVIGASVSTNTNTSVVE